MARRGFQENAEDCVKHYVSMTTEIALGSPCAQGKDAPFLQDQRAFRRRTGLMYKTRTALHE